MRALGERADEAEKARDVMTDALITMRMERDLERARVRELTRQLHEARQESEARAREDKARALHVHGPKGGRP